jgi:hypothetical protein
MLHLIYNRDIIDVEPWTIVKVAEAIETYDWLFIVLSRSRSSHLYGDVTIAGEGLQNLGLCSALWAFEQGGIPIVPHLLWHGASVSSVSSKSRLLRHARGWWGLILTRILLGLLINPDPFGSPYSHFLRHARGCWEPILIWRHDTIKSNLIKHQWYFVNRVLNMSSLVKHVSISYREQCESKLLFLILYQ